MEVPIPEWLNKEFLSDCLQNESKESDVCVEDFQAESAVPPGNNYGSIVVRVRLQYTSPSNPQPSSKSLIVKCPLTSGAINDLFGALDKEYVFYHDYLPKAYSKLKRFYAPKSYPSSIKEVVVLEDLKQAGYIMGSKQEMLGYDQCNQYVEAAAAFHAGSIPVFKQNPKLQNDLGSELMFSNELRVAKSQRNMFRYGLEAFADCLQEIPGNKRAIRIIKKSATVLWDMVVDAVKPTGPLNTINQGDPWPTNMMFKYDDKGCCTGIKILDFQALRYTSPASDFTIFMWCSGKHYVREEKFEQLCQTYVQAFNECCEETGVEERLTMEMFKQEVLKMSPLALWAGGLCIPMVQYEDAPDFNALYQKCDEEYCAENNPVAFMFTEKIGKTELPRLMKQFEQLGVLDHIENLMDKY